MKLKTSLLLLATLLLTHARAAEDIVIADFDGAGYGAWKAEGQAFGTAPARGTQPRQGRVEGFLGKGLVNSYFGGDGATGRLTSAAFRIERKHLNFLIGGGGFAGETCINLLVDGKPVRTATGPNIQPGGTEALEWSSWDVGEFAGRDAQIEIVDSRRGGWGHINVDQIVLSDRSMKAEPAVRKLAVEKRYLHLPVKNRAPKRRMRFEVEGRTVREFEIEFAEEEPDLWVFSDVGSFRGKELRIETKLLSGPQGLERIAQSDEIPGAAVMYREALRPQLHFTPRLGWNNDPNGMVFSEGEYHLFFQHNPYGIAWGNMHWGHAVSPDLVHWTELPVAIYPKAFGDWVYSGGAIADRKNTAGFRAGTNQVIAASFTSTGRGECIAFSNDRGRTFTDFEGNPVLAHKGRDPKIVRYDPGDKWVMVVYNEPGEGAFEYAFYESRDLKQWTRLSSVPGFYECPEFFEMPLDGRSSERKWVLHGAARREENGKRIVARSSYRVGTFDGTTFTPETEILDGHHGPNFYAAQTFTDAPNGRRIMIGWLSGAKYAGMPFSQGFTIPLELTLRTTPAGPRMFFAPVRELDALRGKKREAGSLSPAEADDLLGSLDAPLLDLLIEIEPNGGDVQLDIRGLKIAWRASTSTLEFQDKGVALPLENGRIHLRALVDRSVLELFANGGAAAFSAGGDVFSPEHTAIRFTAGANARVTALQAFDLRGIWP